MLVCYLKSGVERIGEEGVMRLLQYLFHSKFKGLRWYVQAVIGTGEKMKDDPGNLL